MSKRMIAEFSDDAYKAIQNGDAFFNNGFRKRRGPFYPDQPTFKPLNERNEKIKDSLVNAGIYALEVLAVRVIVPAGTRFINERMYPFVVEKWDEHVERRKEEKEEKEWQAQNKKIIDIREFKKRA